MPARINTKKTSKSPQNRPPSPNELALQLLPEHRLFAQAFVATRGDRGRCIVAMNRPCPTRAIRSRFASVLSRPDVRRYIYTMLLTEPAAVADFRADPEWRGFIAELLRQGSAGELELSCPSVSSSIAPVGTVIPADAREGSPDVGFASPLEIGDLTSIQAFWRDMMRDSYQPGQVRLKASELYARSLGAFDPKTTKSTRTPITISMPAKTDDDDEED